MILMDINADLRMVNAMTVPKSNGWLAARNAILDSSTFQMVLAKPPSSRSLGFGIVFNFKIQRGHVVLFTACKCE